mmetsp:Transcript_17850/g.38749  ORF Transcript_17850/g.38749 Transcript_17850/m.38749 type:complete len:603 (+) Transcript_17850:202-2010(+)
MISSLTLSASAMVFTTIIFVLLSIQKNEIAPVSAFVPSRPVLIQAVKHTQTWSSSNADSDTGTGTSNKPKTKRKLSRPERKAQERARNQRNNNRNGRKRRNTSSNNRNSTGKEFRLHSTAISKLTSSSTADDVVKAIKRAQNMHDVHDIRNIERFLLEEVDESFAYGYRGSLLSRLAVAAMHMNNNELARKAIEVRREVHRSSMMPLESAAVIRGLLRMHNITDAIDILDDELSLPLKGTQLDTPENQERIKHRALSIASIASRSFFEDHPFMGVKAMKWLTELGPLVRESGLTVEALSMPWARIIQGAAQCESKRRDGALKFLDAADGDDGNDNEEETELPCNLVYAVLDAMATFPSDNNDRTYEALSNALVRRTLFITGAVSLTGCPPADRGESAFIGRSNVGKSSLVNMITNRKSLAYTSKRPGKTQQFNFFSVNDKPGREREIKYGDDIPGEKDLDSFYIVDLPGFGFAKVPQQQRQEWSEFFQDYVANRRNLKILFHLVDARHGPIDEDSRIMKQVSETLPKNVKYVVVLTKADKNVKGPSTKNSGKVTRSTLESVRETMKANGVGNAPVLLTSSETKLGRDDLWRYLRLAAEAKVE